MEKAVFPGCRVFFKQLEHKTVVDKIQMDAIKTKDLDFCYQVLEKTLDTAAVLTQARSQAGINFPCDKS